MNTKLMFVVVHVMYDVPVHEKECIYHFVSIHNGCNLHVRCSSEMLWAKIVLVVLR